MTPNKQAARRTSQRPPQQARPTRKFPLIPVIGGVAAVALIVTVLLTFDQGGGGGLEVGNPEMTGPGLPAFVDSAQDAAVGLAAPEVSGTDFGDQPVTITNDGTAKMIMFVAHWCPHCQREVPIVSDWLAANPLPAGIDFYSVSTGVSDVRDNYPPSSWLERENWNVPVLMDDSVGSVAGAFGLNAYPYWVFVEADGTVAGRVSGGVEPATLNLIVADLATP